MTANKKLSQMKAPIFLRKTYDMIETCDNALANWAEDGLHFVVKDTEKFALEVIPQYFKHNNFSSFVRQLNFYGFRKIKLDPIKIDLQQIERETKYWRFKHNKFRRGRQDLLCYVRKGNHGDGPDMEEYDAMKAQVRSLKKEVLSLTGEIRSLMDILKERGLSTDKRTLETSTPVSPPEINKRPRITGIPILPEPTPVSIPEANVFGQNVQLVGTVNAVRTAPVNQTQIGGEGRLRRGSMCSFSSMGTIEAECLLELDAVNPGNSSSTNHSGTVTQGDLPEPSTSPRSVVSMDESGSSQKEEENRATPVSNNTMSKLHTALSTLPDDLQQTVVERVVSAVSNSQQRHQNISHMSSV